jgi:ribosomal protein S18 acetylase RimI-like enzyme
MYSRHAQAKEDNILNEATTWYLEVIAVDPQAQGQGVGGQLLTWLCNHVGSKDCLLECTAQSNIAFYEKFGFRVVEEFQLSDATGSVTEWVMVRDSSMLLS